MTDQKFFHLLRKLFHLLSTGLGHWYFPIVLVALAILIMTPALKVGWVSDDMIHRLGLLDPSRVDDKLIDLFTLPDGTYRLSFVVNHLYSFIRPEANLGQHIDYGFFPWWTYEKLRISFWRPLASFTLWLDYQLFPDSAPLMHAHSILWFAAVVFLVAILYRRIIGPIWIAGLAGLFYALDENYYFPVMLLANRHTLLALAFGILAFLAHRRWRQDNSLSAATLSFCFFVLSLLSAEAGIATLIYIFAYALVLDNAKWLKRGLSLVPYVIVVVLWRIIYNALGHGAYGSGFYLDPVREPTLFAKAVLERGPIFFLGQLGGLPSIMFNYFSDSAKVVYWLGAVGFMVFVLAIFLPLLRNNRVARFWLVAMLLSILPVCATFPMNRNLLFVGVGAMALVAQFVAGLFTKETWLPKSRLWRVPAWLLCIILLLVHVGLAGAARVTLPKMIAVALDNTGKAMDIGSPAGLQEQDLVVVNTPIPGAFLVLFGLRSTQGSPLPRAIRTLSPAFSPAQAIRTENNVLLLRSQTGSFLSTSRRQKDHLYHNAYFLEHFNSLLRGAGYPLRPGDRIDIPRMSVQVTRVDSRGRPTEAIFRFAVSLDDPSLRWLYWDWNKGSFSPFKVPAIGEPSYIAGPFQ